MRALFLAPFYSAETPSCRPRTVACAASRLAKVDVVTSDFDHARKIRREHRQYPGIDNTIYLRTLPYRSNVSIQRFVSHLCFSIRAAMFAFRHASEYDFFYATSPLSTLACLVFSLAGGKPKFLDVVDIWPDVLPFPRSVKVIFAPFFGLWHLFFTLAVRRADAILSVSDSFFNACAIDGMKTGERIFIGHPVLQSTVAKDDVFSIAYVGNLGRLYDFSSLILALSDERLRSRIQFVIVGGGDRQEWLISELNKHNIQYQFHGTVYDHAKLAAILRRCHLGFNGYINTTAAFSYKAGTYFAAALPILNSMQGDLWTLVADRGLGRNYTPGDHVALRNAIIDLMSKDIATHTSNVEQFYTSELHPDVITSRLQDFFSKQLQKLLNCRNNASVLAPPHKT